MNQEICRVFFFLLKRREDVDREASCSRWNRRGILDTIMSVDLCSTNKNLICQSLMCVWCDLVIGRFNNTGFYQ